MKIDDNYGRGMFIAHQGYNAIDAWTNHDARAVLLNARDHLLRNITDEANNDAFYLLGEVFDRVWRDGTPVSK